MDAIQSAVTDANIDEWIRVVRYLLHSQHMLSLIYKIQIHI